MSEPREAAPRSRAPRDRAPRERSAPRSSPRTPRLAPPPDPLRDRDEPPARAPREPRETRDTRDSRDVREPATDWAVLPREQREHKPQGTSLVAGRLPTGEIAGHVIYRGSQNGDAVVVGLFDASQPGTQLEYWVELDGPGPYVLDGLKPGRYELHACLASSISESGLPREILACGVFRNGTQISVSPGDVLDGRDVELYDELPSGMLQGIDTVFYDVTDMEQSVSFYRDVLNLPLTLKERSWAEFDTGSCILALRRKPEPPPGYRAPQRRGGEATGAQVVFRVRDLEKVRDELTHRGVKFLGRVIEIPEARWSTFTDPDGNKMQLFERKTR